MGLMVILVMTGFVRSANAASFYSAIQEQINALLSRLQDAPTPRFTSCVVPQGTLALGSRGTEVKKLQTWLNEHGYPVVAPGTESEYFGPLTHFALLKFQSVSGIRPPTGFYGSLTKAEIERRCEVERLAQTGLRFSLSEESGKNEKVPAGSTRLNVLSFDVSGKSTLNSLTLRRYGPDARPGFHSVYLFDGDVRLTNEYTFDVRTGLLTFDNLNLSVDGQKTISVIADISNANDFTKEGVELVDAAAVSAEGVVVGSFPIRGGLFERLEQKVGRLAIEKNGNQLNDPLIGEAAVEIADFKLIPEAKESLLLHSIALRIDASFDGNLISNFVLKQDDRVVATAATVNARGYVVLRPSERMILETGVPRQLQLFADFSAAIKPNATLRVYLDAPVDLYAVGSAGRGVEILDAKYNNSANNGTDASWLTIRGGVAGYTFKGPGASNYVVGQTGAELLRFEVRAEHNIEMRELRFTLAAGGADATGLLTTPGGLCNNNKPNYTNLRLVDVQSGALLARAYDAACSTGAQDASRTIVFTDRWNVTGGGSRVVRLVADIGSFTPASDETVRAILLGFEREDIRDLDTNNYLGNRDVVPAGNISGATHHIFGNTDAATRADLLMLSFAL